MAFIRSLATCLLVLLFISPFANAEAFSSNQEGALSELNATGLSELSTVDDEWYWEVDLGLVLNQRKALIEELDDVNADAELALWVSGGLYYRNFFIESIPNRNNQLTIGYTLQESDTQQINLVASSWFYPFSQNDQKGDSNLLDGIQKRKATSEVGIELNTQYRGFETQFRVLHDTFSVHDGAIVNLNISKSFFTNTVYIRPSLGLAYITKNALDYYYGINAHEATSARPEYHPSGDWIAAARLYLDRPINKDWSMIASFNFTYVGEKISDSPIVNSHYSYDINIGVLWAF